MRRCKLPTDDGRKWHFVHNFNRPLAERVKSRKVCGPYYMTRRDPTQHDEIGFYAGDDDGTPSDSVFCLRAELADVKHNGWYTDNTFQDDTLKPVRYRLPHGRGFLAGWTAGANMYSAIDTSVIHDCEREADHAADEMARVAAERECEYQAEQRENEDE